jgi:hypothetical protein
MNGSERGTLSYVDAYRFQFFVPRRFNADAFGERRPVPNRKFLALHHRILDRFPGLTVSKARPPMGHGLWLNETRSLIPDECYLYDVILDRQAEYLEFFDTLLREFLSQSDEAELGLDQDAALLVLTEVKTLYVERPSSGP